VTDEELDQLCKLSLINIRDDEERSRFKKDLSTIISWMDQIHDVEVADLTPFDHHDLERKGLSSNGTKRSLEMHSFENHHVELGADKILANTPHKEMDYIIAPKVQVEDS
jgi:aspartyl/glutamyl-tRNA(Asn/Gln) amidotransferase C subunit